MKKLLGVFGLVLSVACGGSEDDGSGDTTPTVEDSNNPIPIIEDSNNPIPIIEDSNNPIPIIESASGAPKVGQPDGVDPKPAGYEYTLHGSDADIDAWLTASDVVVERSHAGGLTFVIARSAALRAIPASLQP